MKRVTLLAALAAMLAFGATIASATASFSAPIYRSGTSSCNTGATNTSGAKFGTFAVSETSGYQLVNASVTVDNLYANRSYNVSVTEAGHTCLTDANVASFTTDAGGKAVVHFQFTAHSGETAAWVTIRHALTTDILRSTTVPINR